MIAVDTNILLNAHRIDSPWHEAADAGLASLAESPAPWAIPWPCIHEFLAIATHPRVFDPPTPVEDALEQVECWREAPGLVMLGEAPDYWSRLRALVERGRIQGGRIHDARIAAICLQHGVTELWSADRDFSRFAALTVVNPLLRPRT
jgi:toxin-antitoxin system PIN domain toxin